MRGRGTRYAHDCLLCVHSVAPARGRQSVKLGKGCPRRGVDLLLAEQQVTGLLPFGAHRLGKRGARVIAVYVG